MDLAKAPLIVLLVLSLAITGMAQKPKVHHGGKSMYTKERFSGNSFRMKKSKAEILCPIFESSKYPYQGIGFKLGDPFAVTYKYYASKNFAFVADFGRASSGLYNRFFREEFATNYGRPDSLAAGTSLTYLTHKVNADWVGDVRFLYHIDASALSPGLQVYAGLGWEWRNTRLQYDYLWEAENRLGRADISRFTMGPQITSGFEYAYFKLPISAFIELELYLDTRLNPGWTKLQGGAGIRYVF